MSLPRGAALAPPHSSFSPQVAGGEKATLANADCEPQRRLRTINLSSGTTLCPKLRGMHWEPGWALPWGHPPGTAANREHLVATKSPARRGGELLQLRPALLPAVLWGCCSPQRELHWRARGDKEASA